MIEPSTVFGLSIFASALSVAVALYIVDWYEGINLSLPFGPAIPYAIAVGGAGVFFLAERGMIGLMESVAVAIFVGAVVKYTKTLNEVD